MIPAGPGRAPAGGGANGPLEGIRVIDVTSTFLGPYCTQILGDMGADVIKVERPDGDILRHLGPSRNAGMGPIHLNVNRNKRSVVLDLRQEAGYEVLLRLVRSADVFIHNMRRRAVEQLGISYGRLAETHPGLLYCGAYGYAQDGPEADRPAYDDVVQGAVGLPSVQGDAEPVYVRTAIADKTAGLMAACAIAIGLVERERSGRGQEIEVPMYETMVSYTLVEHMYGMTFDPPRGAAIYPRVVSEYRRPHRTADGYVCMVVYTDDQWAEFFEIAGRPELSRDPRFDTIAARTSHIDELYRFVDELTVKRPTAEWLDLLEAADIPVGPLRTTEEVLEDPDLRRRGFVRLVEHPTEGRIRLVENPVHFSRTPAGVRRLAPTLGEHTSEVLREVGCSADEITEVIDADLSPPTE